MLILSRRINESIIIDDKIKITVLQIRGGQLKLGIEAPDSIVVDREEISNRKKEGIPYVPRKI